METALDRTHVLNLLVLLTNTATDKEVLRWTRAILDRHEKARATFLHVPLGLFDRRGELAGTAPVSVGELPAQSRVLARGGDPVDLVLREAREEGVDLIVGAVAGMVSQRLVRRSSCSLLILSGARRSPEGTILALVDFSPESLIAARRACELGAAECSPVELLHVFPIPWDSAKGTRERARHEMDEFVRALGAPDVELTARVELAEIGGYVVPSLLAEIRRGCYSQVFVGSRPRRGLFGFAMASVAERVVLSCDLPVWVVRAGPPHPPQDPVR